MLDLIFSIVESLAFARLVEAVEGFIVFLLGLGV